ncbi:MAG: PilZ domain-containing protein [Butyribacter sp.]|nr:PilZ domain-containing protein [bacterium]MDY3855292.1 PilZ domain-containing protein [Butyribacter sp.]
MEKMEQRRAKRIPVSLSLEVSSLFKQDNVKVNNINAPIIVHDISKSGIGFSTESTLPIGYYFNARLEFARKDEVLNCVVRIIRQGNTEDGRKFYGCEFVGLSPVLDYIFENIEKESEKKE